MGKIQNGLFYLLILLFPIQLGRHFWPASSFLSGLRIDYLSPTIYLTDILIFGIFALWLGERVKTKNLVFWLFIFSLLFINSLQSFRPPVAFYKLLKLSELSFLGIYILQKIESKDQWQKIITFLMIGIFYESLIALGQFLKQGSIGGPLWWLGERTFTSGTPGIAQAIINGELILRVYGTFPHPNVLGGYVAVVLPLAILNYKLLIASLSKTKLLFYNFFFTLTLILGTVTIFLTFSRSAWLVFSLALISCGAWFLKRNPKYWKLIALLVFIGSISIYSFFPQSKGLIKVEKESITQRRNLNLTAFKMIKKYPLTGVGLGNFLVRLPEFYQEKGRGRLIQPAHNIYLMIGAETGLGGLGLFLGLIFLTYKKLLNRFNNLTRLPAGLAIPQFSLIIALTTILILGLFDHYFYTLQHGQLLFSLILGLSWGRYESKAKNCF